jgi:hypothetical protein
MNAIAGCGLEAFLPGTSAQFSHRVDRPSRKWGKMTPNMQSLGRSQPKETLNNPLKRPKKARARH